MSKGCWQVVWEDRNKDRRVDYSSDSSERARKQWSQYVQTMGGRILFMRLTTEKPEGRHGIEER